MKPKGCSNHIFFQTVINLQKAQSVIAALREATMWPDFLTPVPADDDGIRAFWPEGFYSAGMAAGIKQQEKKDLMILFSAKPASAAAVFTRNICSAAPVTVSKEHLLRSSATMRAIVCNSGNANAATGIKGMDDARAMAEETAKVSGLKPQEVFVASTGVIGQLLPMEKIMGSLPRLASELRRDALLDTVEAIMTTDTFEKFFALDVALSAGSVRISGIAKGSGMICPNMATMLCFLATDAGIAPDLLQQALASANSRSFNAITVDGDTSTNDMVAILAGGTGTAIAADTDDYRLFQEALETLMIFLAKLIVIDGEGATKLVEIKVVGAVDDKEAELAARTIANSSLVKTAIHGEDANWGRIIAAAGRSGALFKQEDVAIFFDDLPVLKPGFLADFSEEEAAEIMKKESYAITVKLGTGAGSSRLWSCDLSKEYIEINGSYRS